MPTLPVGGRPQESPSRRVELDRTEPGKETPGKKKKRDTSIEGGRLSLSRSPGAHREQTTSQKRRKKKIEKERYQGKAAGVRTRQKKMEFLVKRPKQIGGGQKTRGGKMASGVRNPGGGHEPVERTV